jgi:release factor glutamine methyltransferase
MNSNIYIPEEDSYLLKKALEDYLLKIKNKKNLKFLDMGCGSGILAETALKKGLKKNNILCVDINVFAVEELKKKRFRVLKSDLFSNLKKEKFDLIVFNPPYLPFDKKEDKDSQLATTGGKKGSEVINKFLVYGKKHLNEKGKILLLTSSLTKNILWGNWKKKIIAKKKIFFEELYVWELKV